MIVALKQLGFSIDEIRGLTVQEGLTFVDLSRPDTEDEERDKHHGARKATQADIDRIFG